MFGPGVIFTDNVYVMETNQISRLSRPCLKYLQKIYTMSYFIATSLYLTTPIIQLVVSLRVP